ncbi:hemopexin repeat-containing protein [Pleionea sediminis]|uniref:Tc toxin subunit A-related protein n=1 Tax=Pleionea sediminis TaxID=2569479 RepID=UPI0011870006|nr:hemopexin repeat-containing protein [Pleionea sediminis]
MSLNNIENDNMPNYIKLFGDVDFREGEEARSVYSPAAYLTDLLQLIDDEIKAVDDPGTGASDDEVKAYRAQLHQRREDIQDILLDHDSTFELLPYLDIVNQRLEVRVAGLPNGSSREEVYAAAYNKLANAKFPFDLPFDLHNERTKLYAKYLSVSPLKLYQSIAPTINDEVIVKEYLGLSNEQYVNISDNMTVESEIDEAIVNYYGGKLTDLDNVLVDCFKETTDIAHIDLNHLLNWNLSDKEKQTSNTVFNITDTYLNSGLDGYFKFSQDESMLEWVGGSEVIKRKKWLQRAYRFLHLSKALGWSYIDLELVIRTCCHNVLDEEALKSIALVKHAMSKFDISTQEACALYSNMNNHNFGEEDSPVDLFNHFYNGACAEVDERYVGPIEPDQYKGYTPFRATGKILDLVNKPYRTRIARSLGLSDKHLQEIIMGFHSRNDQDIEDESLHFSLWTFKKFQSSQNGTETYEYDTSSNGLSSDYGMLSTLYRTRKLCEYLDWSYSDLFNVLDVVEHDPLVGSEGLNNKFIQRSSLNRNGFDILVNGEVNELQWLVQILESVSQLMLDSSLSSEDLLYFTCGRYPRNLKHTGGDDVKKALTPFEREMQEDVATYDKIYQKFKETLLKPVSYKSTKFSERLSRIAYDFVVDAEGELVSPDDNRLVHKNKQAIKNTAEDVIQYLDVISPSDFLGLGLEEKVASKIFDNLVLIGYLDNSGTVKQDYWPLTVNDFFLETDFNSIKDELFNKISMYCKEYVDATLNPSDLEFLDLTVEERNELIDNLIFNGYLDESNVVIEKSTFESQENISLFDVNSNIGVFAESVYNYIQLRVEKFKKSRVKVSSSLFEELELSEQEGSLLLENLIVNEYLSEECIIKDNEVMLSLNEKEFLLDIQFYPHRKQILRSIKTRIKKVQESYLVLGREQFNKIADSVVASWIFKVMTDFYMVDGRFTAEAMDFFRDNNNSNELDIHWPFTKHDNGLVFKRVQSILNEVDSYRFTSSHLSSLDFSDSEYDDLIDVLINNGSLSEDWTITPEKVEYFLILDNALTYELEGFEDYNKDVFFLIHGLAKRVSETKSDFINSHNRIAQQQQDVIYQMLSEAFSLEREAVEALTNEMFGDSMMVSDTWILPLLNSVDVFDKISEPPKNRLFNKSFRRIKRFAKLSEQLKLSTHEIVIAFRDQSIVNKLPIDIELPTYTIKGKTGISDKIIEIQQTGFDALLESMDGYIYIFKNAETSDINYEDDYPRYWMFSSITSEKEDTEDDSLSTLLTGNKDKLVEFESVHAAFVNENDQDVIIIGDSYYYRNLITEEEEEEAVNRKEKGCFPRHRKWHRVKREWGRTHNNFSKLKRVDAAFTDLSGQSYLFSDSQFVRYTKSSNGSYDYSTIDADYPKDIQSDWHVEGLSGVLHEDFKCGVDAALHGSDHITYFFKDNHFVTSDAPSEKKSINKHFINGKNNIADGQEVSACFTMNGKTFAFSGDQVFAYRDALENNDLEILEGFPLTIKEFIHETIGDGAVIPSEYLHGIDAAFLGEDEKLHLFVNDKTVIVDFANKTISSEKYLKEDWGNAKSDTDIQSITVDAALAGVDGRIYIFSGTQYYRYSSEDYTKVDDGYPRSIAEDWQGLSTINAAFIMDGKTYIFGMGDYVDAQGVVRTQQDIYVRYSTNDYKVPDQDYPKLQDEVTEYWWNFPEGFGTGTVDVIDGVTARKQVDAVFNAPNNKTYVFSGNQFIAFDHINRWWSEPKYIADEWHQWAGAGINKIDAAFCGKDGRSYLFSGNRFVILSDKDLCNIEYGYPKLIGSLWCKVVDPLSQCGKINAAVFLSSVEYKDNGGDINAEKIKEINRYTYLFSGDHYYRYVYSGNSYLLDSGYPRTVAHFKDEPRFKYLDEETSTLFETDANWLSHINAIAADERSVFMFEGRNLHVLSDSLNKVYGDNSSVYQNIDCALSYEGAFFVKQNNSWKHLSAPEQSSVMLTPELPSLLKHISNDDNIQLDAVLQGLDDNTYLFMDDCYYDTQLNREYKISSKWGRERNNIQDKGKIDAVLRREDGKTYLFSGDQYVVYHTDTYVGENVYRRTLQDQAVHLIEDDWFGLQSIDLAYNLGEKTYLFEKPDYNGQRRYVCLSSCDWENKHDVNPKMCSDNFWNLPEHLLAEGWNLPDGILVDDQLTTLEQVEGKFKTVLGDSKEDEEHHTLIFVKDGQFVQLNTRTDRWTKPCSINKLWEGLNCEEDFFDELTSIFVYEGNVYLFADNCYRISRVTTGTNNTLTRLLEEPKAIKDDWAIVEPRVERIDAAFVYDNKHTYLFSGSDYIRYEDHDYCHVPAGYPKRIAESLRQEPGFEHLPHGFESYVNQIVNMASTGINPVIIKAALTNDQNIYLFFEDRCLAVGKEKRRNMQVGLLGNKHNAFSQYGKIDAAFRKEDVTYLFSGDQYLRYSECGYHKPDAGYPKSIERDFVADYFRDQVNINFELPKSFCKNVSAALVDHETVYLFKGREFIKLENGESVQLVEGNWGQVNNLFVDENGEPKQGAIDGAFVDNEGRLYVIKQNQVIRYKDTEQTFIEKGFPKHINSVFKQLPLSYESGIDGAFTYAGQTYLFKNAVNVEERADYVKYDNSNYDCLSRPLLSSIYPMYFDEKWGSIADYRLRDLSTISCFKMLVEDYGSDQSVVDVLRQDSGYINKPYELLAELFDWDIDELKWLKRHNAFLPTQVNDERRYDLELLCRMHDIFQLMSEISADVRTFYTDFWSKRFEENMTDKPADYLLGLLGSKYCGDKSQDVLIDELHNHLNVMKRDALVPYVIENNDRSIIDARDLYEDMLVDVNMSECMETSKIKEAISALQLYFHRYFIGLEPAQLIDEGEPGKAILASERRERLKDRWDWLKSYRVWEANRKVFLYPENYIRPELRDTKSPQFEALEEKLLQGELNEDNIAKAINHYTNEFSVVSQLTISGGYVYSDPKSPSDKSVILFGRTKTQPEMYYYRIGTFVARRSDAVKWQPWKSVDIQIEAKRVYPVYALNRFYVFWAKVEDRSDAGPNTSSKFEKKGENFNSKSNVTNSTALTFYYSSTDLNGQWSPAQKLNYEIPSSDTIVESLLDFSDIKVNSKNEIDHIEVKCIYTSEREIKPVADSEGRIETGELIDQIVSANDDNSRYVYFKVNNGNGTFYLTDEIDSSSGNWHGYQRSLRASRLLPGEELENSFRYQITINPWNRSPNEFSIIAFNNSNNGWWNSHGDKGWLGQFRVDHGSSCRKRFEFALYKSSVTAGYSLVGEDDLYLMVDESNGFVRYADIKSLTNNDQRLRTVIKIIANRKELKSSFRFFPESRKVATVPGTSGKIGLEEKSLLIRGLKTFKELFPAEDDNNLNQAILLNSPKDDTSLTWASFDYKGASFMCMPLSGTAGVYTPHNIALNGFKVISAVNIEDDTWLFSDNKKFIKAQQNDISSNQPLPNSQNITDVWGITPNAWENIDAAFVQGAVTHLIKGEEYISYPNGKYDVIPAGYPKSLAQNREMLPQAAVDATFRADSVNYFVRGEDWYKVDEFGQEVQMPGRLWPESDEVGVGEISPTEAKAYLKVNGVAYAIGNSNRLLKLTNSNFEGQANSNFSQSSSQLPHCNRRAFMMNGKLYITTDSEDRYRYNIGGLEAAHAHNGWTYAIIKNASNEYEVRSWNNSYDPIRKYIIKTKSGQTIDNLFWLKDRFYIISGNDYYTFMSLDNHRDISGTPDGQLVDIIEKAKIFSVIVKQDTVVVMTSDRYIKFDKSELKETSPSLPMPQAILGNSDGIPQNLDVIDAAFFSNERVAYYFGTTHFITDETNASLEQISGNWGRLKNNLQDDGEYKGRVDAAFTKGDYLYLISGDQYYRYAKINLDSPQLDTGYPKLLEGNLEGIISENKNFDFAFTLGIDENVYYVSKARIKNVPFLDIQWDGGSTQYDVAYNIGIDKLYIINGNKGYMESEPQEILTDEDYAEYDLIRLSSMAGSKLSQIIFNKGVKGVMSLESQFMDEAPRFELSSSTTANTQEAVIRATPNKVSPSRFPVDTHLEFKGANGQYYWELFYHAPSLIAQSLNNAQQFEEAKSWYECIYDPTSINEYWQFVPFNQIDIVAINKQIRDMSEMPLSLDRNIISALTDKLLPFVPFFAGEKDLSDGAIDELKALREWSDEDKVYKTWEELYRVQVALRDSLPTSIIETVNEANLLITLNQLPPSPNEAPSLTTCQVIRLRIKHLLSNNPSPSDVLLAQSSQKALDDNCIDISKIIDLRIEMLLSSELTDEKKDLAKAAHKANELLSMTTRLYQRYRYLQTSMEQIKTYLNDPFDPHAIAALRINAYRRTTVMAYIDNLLDWGDHLFRRYTRESIGEARMLYVLAYDMLGKKPENLGKRYLTDDLSFREIRQNGAGIASPFPEFDVINFDRENYDFLFDTEGDPTVTSLSHNGTVHESVANPYFYVPENNFVLRYWERVEDRLHKIRHCLNIEGVKQPLPLFQPPIDPMALVNAVASGGSLQAALESMNLPVPHYRFNFMLNKAREVSEKASQLGNELLAAIEKKDAEELSQMQTKHEGQIIELTKEVRVAQIDEIGANIENLKESMVSAKQQLDHYNGLVSEGMITSEQVQIGMMTAASVMFVAIPILKFAGAAVTAAAPDVKVGAPTTIGATKGGSSIGAGLTFSAEALESIAEGISMGAEVAGMYAQHQRSVEDWKHQAVVFDSEIKQIGHQLESANRQMDAAKQELKINQKEQENNASIMTFMKEKFSNKDLYLWMQGKLSALYYQAYNMAHDLAKIAEVAYRYERGLYADKVNFINGHYWDNAQKGLLAGDSLGIDLNKMEKSYLDTNKRSFEITKTISLLDIDPLEFFKLKKDGVCEFSFKEEHFDYDFPGHYCRQIKTLSVKLNAGEGKTVFATLTQLNNKTLLAPDVKAVKYLLSPKDLSPVSIRHDWRPSQQIAVSQVDQYSGQSSGLFELNFGDDRYLPFEGTGAVSRWRLELGGKKGSYNLKDLQDLEIELKYTAKQGGEDFADAVRGLLKPYDTAVQLNIAEAFPREFYAFVQDETDELRINITRDMLPNISGSKINGIYPIFETQDDSAFSMVLNDDDELKIKNHKLLFTNGLSVSRKGETWTFKARGKKSLLTNMILVLGYKASAL